MALQKKNIDTNQLVRYVAVGALTVAAFLGAYRFAQARTVQAEQNVSATPAAVAAGSGVAAQASASGGGCCGGGASGSAAGGGCCGGGGASSSAQVSGKAKLSGKLQKVTIDLTTGSYSPNRIVAKAGIPLELDFKGPASGCNGTVVSQQLGFQQDVSNGGSIDVGALAPGTYTWTCGMGMYVGRIVVQ